MHKIRISTKRAFILFLSVSVIELWKQQAAVASNICSIIDNNRANYELIQVTNCFLKNKQCVSIDFVRYRKKIIWRSVRKREIYTVGNVHKNRTKIIFHTITTTRF